MLKKTLMIVVAALTIGSFLAVAGAADTAAADLQKARKIVKKAPAMIQTRAVALSPDQLALAVRAHLFLENQDNRLEIWNDEQGAEVTLVLKKVTEDSFMIRDNLFVVPAAFNGPDDEEYIVDFYVLGKSLDEAEVTGFSVRSIDGVALYEWRPLELFYKQALP
ncbi:MAG: hypothetical protein M5R36_11685 [Deltaproteobacteria bacterium]|nr:hypothetical protein [Deltaproteobacteria bacterium]